MRNIILLTLFLNGLHTSAQNNYIITHQKDTLFGKVSARGLIFGRKLLIRTENGKEKIHENRVHEYRIKNTYMYVPVKNRKGNILMHRSMVLVLDPTRLLSDVSSNGEDYFVYLNNTFYEVNRRYFSEDVWDILIQCPSFSEKYGTYRQEHLNKKWMFFPKQENEWREMLGFYNQRCGGR